MVHICLHIRSSFGDILVFLDLLFTPQVHNQRETEKQRTTIRKYPMVNRMVTWPMTLRRDPERSNRDLNTLRAIKKTAGNAIQQLNSRWGLLDSLLWDSTAGYPSDSLASCLNWSCPRFEFQIMFGVSRCRYESSVYIAYKAYAQAVRLIRWLFKC